MLTNLENQLREQGATDRLDDVLEEIPRVREELGFIPLVTPTSQIVGAQALINVLSGTRYANVTRETAAVLKGEYGATPAPVDADLQRQILGEDDAVTCRPADLLEPEVDRLSIELERIAGEKSIALARETIDDVLTYALFPTIGLKFLENRGRADAFEPVPDGTTGQETVPASGNGKAPVDPDTPAVYRVTVNGKSFQVEVSADGAPVAAVAVAQGNGVAVPAMLAGNVFKLVAQPGTHVERGQPVLVLEAMKMETDVVAPRSGTLTRFHVEAGQAVAAGDPLFDLG